MLLSVTSALYTSPGSRFSFQNTGTITSYQPDEDEFDQQPGFNVIVTRLEYPTFDALNNIMRAKDTVVWAPIIRLFTLETTRRTDFVYCAHDVESLHSGRHAYFYIPDDLKAILWHAHSRAVPLFSVFDPLTYGTGEVARLRHPNTPTQAPGYIESVQAAFYRSRGPKPNEHAAVMPYSFEPAGSGTTTDRGPAVRRIELFSSPHEQACMYARLYSVMQTIPRAPAQRLPLNPAAVNVALLPRGASHNACCEGVVVQSPAAWSIRTDPRVMKALASLDSEATYPVDLPVVCFTGASMRQAFLDNSVPWLSRNTQRDNGVTWMGVVALGPTPLPVWTVHEHTMVPDNLFDSSGHIQEDPIALEWEPAFGRINQFNTRTTWLERLGENFDNNTTLTLYFTGRRQIRLRYTSCPPGFMVVTNVAQLAFTVRLPSAQLRPDDQIVLGLRVAAATSQIPGLPARCKEGTCPLTDPLQQPTGVVMTPAELTRFIRLLPNALPYNTEPALATHQRDARTQNLLYALPHVYDLLSPHLRTKLEA